MKILMVTDKMDIGGAETHILTLIRELASRGESITLLSGGGIYADSLRKKGIRVVYSPFDKRDPFSILRCKRILAEEMQKCDIVHTHTRFSSFLAGKIRGKRKFPAIITTAHLNFKLFPFGRLAFFGDRTLAVSEDIREYLKKNYGIDDRNITLTRNSIDVSSFDRERIPKKLIIHTSRIDKGRAKTAFLLCGAAMTILKKYPEWRILIVGDGNCFNELKRKVAITNAALGFEGVMLTGARYDIPSILRYDGIFIGVSRSALEGMAAGLPVIICGDEGYGGILSNDNFDLLFKTNFCARGLNLPTEQIIISDIEKLINSSHYREQLSFFSKKTVETLFSPKEMASDAEECYNFTRIAPSVCLLGYFGYSNLGDEMMLREAVLALRSRGITDVSVLLQNGLKNASIEKYKYLYKKIKFFDRMSPAEIKLAIDSTDILILCGGNLLQNETSERSLIYYSEIIRYAKRRGARIYMLSSGFGGTSGALGNHLLKRSISLCTYCGCRTVYDLDIANKYCCNSKFMPDFCFLLEESCSNIKKTHFCWIVSKNKLIDIGEILEISNKRGLAPIAVLLNYPEDKVVCQELQRCGIKCVIPESYEDFKTIVSTAAFTISERLHGAIFSIMSHVPAYLTSDTHKKRALIDDCKSIRANAAVLLPYSETSVLEKKEIGARDSDFNYLISYQRREINNALCELFD